LVNAGALLGIGLHIRDNAGRGVRNDAGGDLRLRASTISGNGDGTGAGLLNAGIARIVNSTFTDNGVTIGAGGTISNVAGGQLALFNVTIAGNFTVGAPNSAVINAGALALNSAVLANPGTMPQLSSSGTLFVFNSLSTDSSLPSGNGNLRGVSPELLPLGFNGGSTPNFKPSPSSPLRNAGRSDVVTEPLYGPEPLVDQRGAARVLAGRVDIGAVEEDDLVFRDRFGQ
jgi:hypothetical protein